MFNGNPFSSLPSVTKWMSDDDEMMMMINIIIIIIIYFLFV